MKNCYLIVCSPLMLIGSGFVSLLKYFLLILRSCKKMSHLYKLLIKYVCVLNIFRGVNLVLELKEMHRIKN